MQMTAPTPERPNELWSIDFPRHYKVDVPSFGFASSPMLVGDYLYVQAANGLVKIVKDSGGIVWRSAVTPESIMSNGAFSSPVMVTLNGVEQILATGRQAAGTREGRALGASNTAAEERAAGVQAG